MLLLQTFNKTPHRIETVGEGKPKGRSLAEALSVWSLQPSAKASESMCSGFWEPLLWGLRVQTPLPFAPVTRCRTHGRAACLCLVFRSPPSSVMSEGTPRAASLIQFSILNPSSLQSISFSPGQTLFKEKDRCNPWSFRSWLVELTFVEEKEFGSEAQPGTNSCICWGHTFMLPSGNIRVITVPRFGHFQGEEYILVTVRKKWA